MKNAFSLHRNIKLLKRVTKFEDVTKVFYALTITLCVFLLACSSDGKKTELERNIEKHISVCELVADADRYNQKDVEVSGILVGYHLLVLYSPECSNPTQSVKAEFTAITRQSLIKKFHENTDGKLYRGNFWVSVLLKGRFEKIPDAEEKDSLRNIYELVNFRYKLIINEVKSVEPVPPNLKFPGESK